MKIGIYGGSFDPPHKIHKKMCLAAAREFSLGKIFVLPTAEPPHKQTYGTSASHRFNMALLAFSDGLFTVSDIEQKAGVSYTYQSLLTIKKQYPNDELYLIIGGDSLEEIHTWKHSEIIAQNAEIIVFPRGKAEMKYDFGGVVHTGGTVMPNISSTTLRSLLEFDMDTSEYTAAPVTEYIKKNNLYSRYKNLTGSLRGYLNDEKYFHSAFTAAMGDKIARALKLSQKDRERVYTACILHDCGKQMNAEQAASYGITNYTKALHGFLGEAVAKKDFGITDTEVLEAIRYHTTCAPDMGLIAKIVSVADCIEDSRDYAKLKEVQKAVFENFDDGFKQIIIRKYDNLIKTKTTDDIHPLTKAAHDFYCK